MPDYVFYGLIVLAVVVATIIVAIWLPDDPSSVWDETDDDYD